MAGTSPEERPRQDDAPLLESALRDDEGVARARSRRGIPVWLLPVLGALAAGLLLGYVFFGGSDDPGVGAAAAAPRATAPPVTDDASEPRVVTELARAEPVRIDIPGIGVSSPLVDLGLNTDGTLEVPVDFDKAGWFTGGNYPGDPEGPPGLIAGHVDDITGPAVFYRLPELAIGDEVMVTRADNTVAVFVVTGSRQYPKDALPTDEIYAPVGDSEIVLITCTGDFDQSARSYEDNLVVRATLDTARSLEESDERVAAGMTAPAGNLPNA